MVFFDWSTPIRYFPQLLQGAGLTLVITIAEFFLSLFFGIVVGYIRYKKTNKILYPILTVYIEIMRNTPLLVQLFFLYYGLPQLGIYLPSFAVVFFGLVVNATAFNAEIIRGGIASVPKGQWEAAQCIGLTKGKIFFHVILPQTIRNVGPSLINQFIIYMFGTSLLSALDIRELSRTTAMINGKTFRTFEIYTAALIIYYVLSLGCMYILRKINQKYFPSVSSKGE